MENKSDEMMRDDYNHSLKHRRPGVRASERTLPTSDPGLYLGPAETYAKQRPSERLPSGWLPWRRLTLHRSDRRPSPTFLIAWTNRPVTAS